MSGKRDSDDQKREQRYRDQKLVHCIYTAQLKAPLDEVELEAHLQDHYQQVDAGALTGVSLCEGRRLFHVIEGPEQEVDRLYKTMSIDKASRQTVKLVHKPISQRDFSSMSAAYGEAGKKVFTRLEGNGAPALPRRRLRSLKNRDTANLLEQFLEGRWRSRDD